MLLKGLSSFLCAALLCQGTACLVVKRADNSTATNDSTTVSKSTTTATASDQASNWDYQQDTVQGVALGGWLVIEPYITPSLFTQFGNNEEDMPVDEYTFTKKLGKEEASKQLEKHWSTFFNGADFKNMKAYGFNLVKIPIGYWAFGLLEGDPYVQGQEKYLDKALGWAKVFGIKVWIDLHGLPGSQNGFDNSGKRGDVEWLDSDENVELSYNVLNYIFKKYGSQKYEDVVVGIEIVNEPLSTKLNLTDMLDFYYNSYSDYRLTHGSNNYFIAHDAFEPIGFWNEQFNNNYSNVSSTYLNQTNSGEIFYGVVIDHHHYEIFSTAQSQESSDVRIQNIRDYAGSIGKTQAFHPSVVGEWSGAITDCAKWLNGVGTGARYDGTFNESQLIANSPQSSESKDLELENGSGNSLSAKELNSTTFGKTVNNQAQTRNCSNFLHYKDFTEEHKADIRKFIEIQLIEYQSNSGGWIFWTYKTENAIEWDFQKLTSKELFPRPFNDYKYFHADGSAISSKSESTSSGSSIISVKLGMIIAGMLALAMVL